MDNLQLYNKVREVPAEAKKKIEAGRLKGMTDINPMWRIKVLTEQFGICGIGWKPQIVRTWLDGGANGEVVLNVEILLFVKVDGQWSDGIPGIGGSRFVAKESSGLYTDDEAYKKAYTDALSVACKALGIGADVYFEKDATKYSSISTTETSKNTAKTEAKTNGSTRVEERLTKSEMVEKWGVKNVEETIAWFEKKFGVKFKDWTEEETEAARGVLEQRKIKRESEAARVREGLKNAGGELPFDGV